MHCFYVFNNQLEVHVSARHWLYLCQYRFFTDQPSTEDLQTEFVTGTQITSQMRDKWDCASTACAGYIDDLITISGKSLELRQLEDKEKEEMNNIITYQDKRVVLNPDVVKAYCEFTSDTDETFALVVIELLINMDLSLPGEALAEQIEKELRSEMEMFA